MLPPRYRDAHPIGHGGMGDIYQATDTVLGRTVAVKLLGERYAEDAAVRGRFTREALAAARLSGEPSIVTIFDVGEWAGRPFIVMEHLAGGSLAERLRRRGAQGPAQALDWLGEAARALDAAHRHGVVHRDVKPANLLLDRGGELHVVDFGIASAAGLDSFTKPGTVLGTAGYLSPEQAQGAQTTPASDRYALGVVAFELLAGTRPFERESPTAEAMAHVSAPVPPISSRRPSLPPELDRVFERALAKEPEERYPSCAEFVSALRAALAEAAGAAEPERRSPPMPVSLRRSRRRWPILLAGLLAAGAGGVALAAALTSGGDADRVATPQSSQPVASTTRAKAPRPTTRIVVVTQPGTEQVTVTVAPPSTEPPAPTTTEVPSEPADTETAEEETASVSTGSARDGVRLTDESTGLIRRGRYSEALPLAQSALASLQGSGQLYEAYANYNVGKSLLGVGRCAEALPFLDRSEAIQGRRAEITRDRAAARRCA